MSVREPYESIASYPPALISLSGGSGDPEQIDGEIVSPVLSKHCAVAPVRRTNCSRRTRIARRETRPRPSSAIDSGAFATARIPPLSGAPSGVNDVLLTVVGHHAGWFHSVERQISALDSTDDGAASDV